MNSDALSEQDGHVHQTTSGSAGLLAIWTVTSLFR